MHPLARLDHQHVWHPFTQMREWLRRAPILIESGKGAILRDIDGREYLDANSSIWTNLHGHQHPMLNRAVRRQLDRIAHSSALGLASGPAARLAARLVSAARPPALPRRLPTRPERELSRVFFSDDGSTAIEVALKLAYEFVRRTRGIRLPKFLSMGGAYHGDTVGAVSVGHIDLFHRAYRGLLFKSDQLMAPYCYRCPFNRAAPDRQDARGYRRCGWECVQQTEKLFERRKRAEPYAALVVEPSIQGAAGMIPQPDGWLKRIADLARHHGTLLIADEVMTAFGRVTAGKISATGRRLRSAAPPPLFACQSEGVTPDFLCVAKGLTGGYLPMAATLTNDDVFGAFLGEYEEFKTFFHGHSYTGNPLGASCALASLDVLESNSSLRARQMLHQAMQDDLQSLWNLPQVGDIRQVGLVAGIELVRNWRTRAPFAMHERVGHRVCEAMARRGVLTRPVGNVIVVMPTYATTRAQMRRIVEVLGEAIDSTLS
jgi:adenosylmethionine-8-amino-7-oxononanoate aminotransferase